MEKFRWNFGKNGDENWGKQGWNLGTMRVEFGAGIWGNLGWNLGKQGWKFGRTETGNLGETGMEVGKTELEFWPKRD